MNDALALQHPSSEADTSLCDAKITMFYLRNCSAKFRCSSGINQINQFYNKSF